MAGFQRGLERQVMDSLKKEPLFIDNLKKDINSNTIFFAIRGGYGSFYLKGSSLFTYKKNMFLTHYKYAFVPCNEVGSYVTERDLKIGIETSFQKGYEKIKERAKLYANIEAEGVSALYKFAPTAENKKSRYFLVDIEVAFDAIGDVENQNIEKENGGKKRTTDRIDILLYDNEHRKLLFCEAKHFLNSEIWANEGDKPKVVCQLKKYNEQIFGNKDYIIKEYTKSFNEYNELIGSELNPPEDVHDKCGLLVFGYDSWQTGKIDKLLKDDGSLEGHNSKFIGNISSNPKNTNTAENIYRELTKAR
jgi:hypothetical protein